MKEKITFDRFIRGLMFVLGAIIVVYLINRLSTALLPFVIGWLIAYMIYPIVIFFEKKCHLKNRVLSIIVTLIVLIVVIGGIIQMIIPPMIEQAARLKTIVVEFLASNQNLLPSNIEKYIKDFLASKDFQNILEGVDFMSIFQKVFSSFANILTGTVGVIVSIISGFIVLLYLFFILLDYESFAEGWKQFVPVKHRGRASKLFSDVAKHMNAYFRGQSLIALCVGILFAIGFTIIDLPMAIALGLFVGLLNLVPYLQTIGFIPATILALLKAADTGQNFWIVMALVLLVFAVVQAIQDLILTPKIMGSMMGLNPAAILLSLSIWGSLLGFIGLIIALPLSTIIIMYYKDYIARDELQLQKESEEKIEEDPSSKKIEQKTE